jgi:hypothetical protein
MTMTLSVVKRNWKSGRTKPNVPGQQKQETNREEPIADLFVLNVARKIFLREFKQNKPKTKQLN